MTTETKPKSKTKWLIISLSGLAILAILSVTLGPRLLVQQATQKPENMGTFVTRQVEQESFQQKMQQALSNTEAVNGGSVTISNPNQSTASDPGQQGQQTHIQVESQTSQNTGNSTDPVTQNNDPVNQQPTNQQQNQTTQPQDQAEIPTRPQDQNQVPQNNTQQNQQQNQQATRPQNRPPQAQQPSQFQVSLSESEISNMIYSGLYQGTAAEYRPSIEGVSTRIANGQASITVALKPKYLPDQFLSKLPGVTRNTPTVYLGGDLSLRKEGNSVTPEIHRLSLGNFRVPMPFIQSAVKSQVQAYTQQMLKLPNGKQAYLDEVLLQNSAVILKGHAQ